VSRTRYELIQTFIAEAGANLGQFAELLATYPELEQVEDANYELYRLAHTVRGSALSLGLENTARAARLGEQRLQEYLFEERRLKRAELKALARWRERLGEMIAGYETGDLVEDEAITELERLFADLDDQPGKRDDD
jgi:chemotaxis protein histidine kinase CheA